MLDAIALEMRGVPAVPVGVAKLVMTTGRGMARIQGFPDFPIAKLEHAMGFLEVDDPKEIEELANQVIPQVESALVGKSLVT